MIRETATQVPSTASRFLRLVTVVATTSLLAGCGGNIARGVSEAILANQDGKEDLRTCEVRGPGFEGMASSLARDKNAATHADNPPVVKILMIHGIGAHTPGHSGPFAEKLARSLGLKVTAPRPKRLDIEHGAHAGTDLGELEVRRFVSEERDREMLFYELTWSSISAPSKKAIAFDDSDQHADRRANINRLAKSFVNDTLPDPLVYAGYKGERILVAAAQSMCWMFSHSWASLPEGSAGTCQIEPASLPLIERDAHGIVTHSLGSRIAIDALQRIANLPDLCENGQDCFTRIMREKTMPVFMFANQLPLIEVGQEPQQVTNEIPAYCTPEGEHYDQRLFKQLDVVAFSDPNDLLSYPIPPEFEEDYMDSRLCPSITNVNLNIAHVRSLFGLGEVADPAVAHSGYSDDERVIAMVAHGAGQTEEAAVVEQRCDFWRTDRGLQ